MSSIRIVAGGALALIMTAGGAMAQTATNTEAGKPIQLLQVLGQPDKTKIKSHPRRALTTAAKPSGKRHSLASRERHRHLATAKARPIRVAEAVKVAGPAVATADVWPAVTPATLPVATAQPSPPPPAAANPAPRELVVAGQTVQVASPNDANEIDRAADTQTQTPSPPAAGPATPAAQPLVVAAAPTASATVAQANDEASHVGSASWIAQVLAALGGAVAAGSAAWFLMGSAPQRTYG